jgi:peptidoglycan/xylan/chitin deacetylase (PgdA/CDA1 family)
MIGPDETIVPSLMFHSVGLDRSGWTWSYLSEPLDSFEEALRLFQARKCTTAFWPEVYDHVARTRHLPPRTLMLTFDDGYLDNWVYVWPLLRKYGMRATVFVTADFIEPDGPPRPTLADVWSGKVRREDLQAAGFLRPSELRIMSESGVIDVQSHGSTHTWLFTGNTLEDVYEPSKYSRYPWLAWNARPDRKPFYLTEDQSTFVPAGEPIFAHEKALAARQFIPDAEAVAAFRSAWQSESQHDAGLKQRLLERLDLARGFPGHYESADERLERIAGELRRSRQELQEITGKPVEFLCWPGGGYDASSVRIARECGFRAFTLGSREAVSKRNRPGESPSTLKRIGMTSRFKVRGVDCGALSASLLWLRIRAHQHSSWHAALLFGAKARAYAATRLMGARA